MIFLIDCTEPMFKKNAEGQIPFEICVKVRYKATDYELSDFCISYSVIGSLLEGYHVIYNSLLTLSKIQAALCCLFTNLMSSSFAPLSFCHTASVIFTRT